MQVWIIFSVFCALVIHVLLLYRKRCYSELTVYNNGMRALYKPMKTGNLFILKSEMIWFVKRMVFLQ